MTKSYLASAAIFVVSASGLASSIPALQQESHLSCQTAFGAIRTQTLTVSSADLDRVQVGLFGATSLLGSDYLMVQEHVHLKNVRSSPLETFEHVTSPLSIVSLKTGGKLTDYQTMIDALNIKPNGVAPGEVQPSGHPYVKFSEQKPGLVGMARSSTGDVYFFHDIELNTTTRLTDPILGRFKSAMLEMTTDGRFVLVKENSGAATEGRAYIWDREKDLGLSVRTNAKWLEIAVSNDKKRLVFSNHVRSGDGRIEYSNTIVNVEDLVWKETSDLVDLDKLKPIRRFKGKILSHSDDLTAFILDRDGGTTYRNGSLRPFALPDLVVARLSKGAIFKMAPLDGWQDVRATLTRLIANQSFMDGRGLNPKMSADGKSLLVEVTINSNQMIHPSGRNILDLIERNWIGLWDLNENKLVGSVSSRELDTEDDSEQTRSKSLTREGFEKPGRMLTTRLLGNGKAVVVRATGNFDSETLASINLKYKILGSSLDNQIGAYHVSGIELPSGFNRERSILNRLEVGDDGKTIVIGHAAGIKILRVENSEALIHPHVPDLSGKPEKLPGR